ncbi:MAG: hypothetical protein N2055_00050 [Tepidimonas taiwanensis]|nr:hypothetical protein [Tepidimonas taiwanensis]
MSRIYRVAGLTMLAEYLGDAVAESLRVHFGGTQLRVPRRRVGKAWDALVRCLGETAAAEMADTFGGEVLYIPRNAADERLARRAQVAQRLAQGQTYAQIARELVFLVRYTERGLRKLMEKYPASGVAYADGQLDLWGEGTRSAPPEVSHTG